MKHASDGSLDQLEGLLEDIRLLGVDGLVERKRGVFYFKSRSMLHFHEDPAGFFADMRLPGDASFVRLAVNSEEERSDLVGQIAERLL